MLDIKAIRKNPELFKKNLARKGVKPDTIDRLISVDKNRRELLQKVETLKAEQNKVSKQIPTLHGTEKETVLAQMKTIANERKLLETELESALDIYDSMLNKLPNPPKDTAPDGKDDEDNEVVKFFGEKPVFDFEPKEHWELATDLDILDQERSAKVSGSRFYYLKNHNQSHQKIND